MLNRIQENKLACHIKTTLSISHTFVLTSVSLHNRDRILNTSLWSPHSCGIEHVMVKHWPAAEVQSKVLVIWYFDAVGVSSLLNLGETSRLRRLAGWGWNTISSIVPLPGLVVSSWGEIINDIFTWLHIICTMGELEFIASHAYHYLYLLNSYYTLSLLVL